MRALEEDSIENGGGSNETGLQLAVVERDDDEILEIPRWPENEFFPPTQPAPLNLVSFTTSAIFIGFVFRALVTYANSFEEVLSIFDLILLLGYPLIGDNRILAMFFTLWFCGTAYVTWRFWTPAIQEYTAHGVDWLANRFRTPIAIFVPPSNAFVSFINRRYLSPVFETRAWLGYVSVASCVALAGLVANENEEGTREFWNISSRSFLTIGFSLLLAGFAVLFSICSDLRMIWRDRYAAEGRPFPPQRPGTGTYIIVTLGMLELVYRTYIVIYNTAFEFTGSRGWANANAFIFTFFGTIQNFCFQAIYALEGSPVIGIINRMILRMPVPVKIVFLGLNGVTIVVINMALSTYNIQTLLVSNFGTPFLVAIIVGGSHSIFIASGDFITSYLDGVVRITMGWDLSPEMRFIQGDRSPAALDNLVRAGRFRVAYAGGQERNNLPDNQAVELLSLEHGQADNAADTQRNGGLGNL
ncbi:MAG: hypothetical protein K2X50_08680 [Gammaproteobacteria bacterium]|nr:hypothetical protein [Gammaproteobacteria bacterium]